MNYKSGKDKDHNVTTSEIHLLGFQVLQQPGPICIYVLWLCVLFQVIFLVISEFTPKVACWECLCIKFRYRLWSFWCASYSAVSEGPFLGFHIWLPQCSGGVCSLTEVGSLYPPCLGSQVLEGPGVNSLCDNHGVILSKLWPKSIM